MLKKLCIINFIAQMVIIIPLTGFCGENVRDQATNKATVTNEKALQEYVAMGNAPAVVKLLDSGMSPNSKCYSDGYPILSFAAMKGRLDIVKILVERGANVNEEGPRGGISKWTGVPGMGGAPLYFAATSGNIEIVKYLLQKGAKVNATNAYGMNALMAAVLLGSPEMVKTLIDSGADVNMKDILGRTALSMAKKKGNAQIIKLLQQAGAR